MGKNLSWVNGGHASPKFSSPTPDNQVTLTQYLNLVVVTRAENPSWRKGQTYFNVLHDVRPDLAEMICGSDIDPFHRDCNLAAFLGQISIMWNT